MGGEEGILPERSEWFRSITLGLTACSGDSWRDPVENTPLIVCVHACGGTDGACHAANDLPRRLSGLRTAPSLARPRPQSCTRRYAVSDRRAGRPCPGVPRWPRRTSLVQLVSASGVSAVCVSPNRALVGAATGTAPGV